MKMNYVQLPFTKLSKEGNSNWSPFYPYKTHTLTRRHM
jgi:hypothetical protein